MKKAIVTGASSGIGKEISRVLTENEFYVYGLGRNFTEYPTKNFTAIVCDFLEINKLVSTIKELNKKNEINLLINCAGTAYYGLHEELNPNKIHEMVTVNIEAPLIITQLLMRNLKRNSGLIINISSVTAKKSNPHGAAYGATKAALSSFSKSIFDESRKYGIRVSSVCPDMTDTNLYRNADFKTDAGREFHIESYQVAETVLNIIKSDINISEVVLQPKKHKILKIKK